MQDRSGAASRRVVRAGSGGTTDRASEIGRGCQAQQAQKQPLERHAFLPIILALSAQVNSLPNRAASRCCTTV